MALATIVIPTFNQAAYLPACVDRCLFQTHEELEILIVDGGSTDGTKDFLDALPGRIGGTYAEPVVHMDALGNVVRERVLAYPQNRRIEIVRFEGDIGATRTYNEGLARARGEYCTYVPGDRQAAGGVFSLSVRENLFLRRAGEPSGPPACASRSRSAARRARCSTASTCGPRTRVSSRSGRSPAATSRR